MPTVPCAAMDPLALIREFVRTKLDGLELDDDDRIFDAGYVRSLFAVEVMLWAEETFNLTIPSSDLDITRFQTISAIHRYITAKIADAVGTVSIS
jgi:methoxymalonate biosynthesis acyl carrier protein